MATCVFCGREIERGTGVMFVKRDGSAVSFCSGKCRKNAQKLKRNPKKLRWSSRVKKGKAAKGAKAS